MKYALPALGALLATTTLASAAGIERSGNNYSFMFQQGNYAELSFSMVRPNISGEYNTQLSALGGASSTGNMAKNFSTVSLAYKHQFNDKFAMGFTVNQPYGASAAYKNGFYNGLEADWKSNSVSVILSYKVNPNITVYGGARRTTSESSTVATDGLIRGALGSGAQRAAAGAAAAAAAGDNATAGVLQARAVALGTLASNTAVDLTYTVGDDVDSQVNYIIGAAYEKPEIALRVALTYESGFTHKYDGVRESNPAAAALGLTPAAVMRTPLEIKMPASLTLDFQTGVAPGTLVFGQIKHTKWSDWHVRPVTYAALTGGELVGLDSDSTAIQLGVGRQINDKFSVFGRLGYERSTGDVASRLAPTDGRRSIGFGGSYKFDNVTLRGGVEYVKLGDAVDSTGTKFEGNSAVGIGLTVGFNF